MTNNTYWQDRMDNVQKLSNKQVTQRLKKLYQQANKRINKEINNIWMQMLEDGEISTANLYKSMRFSNLQNLLQKELYSLGLENEKYLSSALLKVAEHAYTDMNTYINKPADLTILDTETAKQIVAQQYKGAVFSERIWNNTAKLKGVIENKIVETSILGKDVRKASRELNKLMGEGYNQSKRIVVTETSRVYNESCRQKAKDNGYTHYKFLAYEDERTCEECMELDGKIFPIDDTEHMPPLHPNSRSSITIVLPN
ncbi:MAG: minor capsid protein [Clostridia bacterium]|jgi:SPP1 gp7 family putative phage head morphogenesis protein|nr:minor capsid protein [Clostridia bacterium]MCI2014558.1 minor capsid protein [Clostridia bacterium]